MLPSIRPDEPREPSDAELLSRLVAGDAAALGDLFDRHAPTLYPLAERLLRDPEVAEKVLEEAFSSVARQPASFFPTARSLGAYLVRDVRSRCLGLRRSAAQAAMLDARPDTGRPRSRGGISMEQIHRARARLMPCEWNVLELIYFRGLTCPEVAVQTGTTPRQIARRLSCALDVLSFCLDEAWSALTAIHFLQRRLDALDHGVLVADHTGDLVLTNLAVRYGGGRDSTGGVDTAQACRYLHPDGSPVLCVDLRLSRAIRRGEVVFDEPFSICQNTTEQIRTVLTTSAPLYASNGLLVGGVMLCSPVPEIALEPRQFDDFLAATSDSFLALLAQQAA